MTTPLVGRQDELAAQATTRGVLVLWGRCWEGEGAPAFWPWVQVVRLCPDRGTGGAAPGGGRRRTRYRSCGPHGPRTAAGPTGAASARAGGGPVSASGVSSVGAGGGGRPGQGQQPGVADQRGAWPDWEPVSLPVLGEDIDTLAGLMAAS
jgi:hypothetical protein